MGSEPHQTAGRWQAWFLHSRSRDPFEVTCFPRKFLLFLPFLSLCPFLSFCCLSAPKRSSSLEWQLSPIVPPQCYLSLVFLYFSHLVFLWKVVVAAPPAAEGFLKNVLFLSAALKLLIWMYFFISILHSSVLTSQMFLQWLFLPFIFYLIIQIKRKNH